MENNCKCECVRALTRKERYVSFQNELKANINAICTAETVSNIIKSIHQLEDQMEYAREDIQLKEVCGYVEDILGTIRAVKMRDCTRKALLQLLGATVERCDELIAKETYHEHVDRVRWFFLQCAERAEELSDIIDFSKLFGE